MTRRAFTPLLAAAAATAVASTPSVAFSNRVHLTLHPKFREKFVWCLSEVLGCGAPVSPRSGEVVANLDQPILAFGFPGGGSVSVEFSEAALDEKQIRRAAWLEIKTPDAAALKKKILDAGFEQIHHPATSTFYFPLPGGQVIGVMQS